MAQPSTLYRFHLDVSDIDRGFYEEIDFRVAKHPSEADLFLITRVLAYALNYQEGIEFSPQGLGQPDDPCLRVLDLRGTLQLWIDVGNPTARRMHTAAKASKRVKIYTYKAPDILMKEVNTGQIFHVEQMEFYSFSNQFLQALIEILDRQNKWSLMHTDGSLTITCGNKTIQGEIHRHLPMPV